MLKNQKLPSRIKSKLLPSDQSKLNNLSATLKSCSRSSRSSLLQTRSRSSSPSRFHHSSCADFNSKWCATCSGKIHVGLKITYKSKHGIVRYVGPVHFAKGDWIGIELDQPVLFNFPFSFIYNSNRKENMMEEWIISFILRVNPIVDFLFQKNL